MVVYLDMLFAANAFMDFATLTAAARFGGVRAGRMRLLAAAVAGGAYAVGAAMWSWLAVLPLRLLAGLGICWLAFVGQNAFFRLYGLYLLVSAAFAGLAAALGMATERHLLIGAGFYFVVPGRALLLAAAAGYALSGLLLRGDALHGPLRRETETLTVRLDGRESAVRVLHDTGNVLSEPVSGRPVVVLSRAAVMRLLGEQGGALRELRADNAAVCLTRLAPSLARRCGLLPFRAVGTEQGMLLYFRPDSVSRADKSKLDCVIAVDPEATGQGAYDGLIGV